MYALPHVGVDFTGVGETHDSALHFGACIVSPLIRHGADAEA